MQANGACINLTQEGALRLGRQHVAPSFGGAAHVSRVQCELGTHRSDHKQVVKLLNEGVIRMCNSAVTSSSLQQACTVST
ncbi:hypothetical protein WJX82_005845 [Trebouxia sp. C0006]